MTIIGNNYNSRPSTEQKPQISIAWSDRERLSEYFFTNPTKGCKNISNKKKSAKTRKRTTVFCNKILNTTKSISHKMSHTVLHIKK